MYVCISHAAQHGNQTVKKRTPMVCVRVHGYQYGESNGAQERGNRLIYLRGTPIGCLEVKSCVVNRGTMQPLANPRCSLSVTLGQGFAEFSWESRRARRIKMSRASRQVQNLHYTRNNDRMKKNVMGKRRLSVAAIWKPREIREIPLL